MPETRRDRKLWLWIQDQVVNGEPGAMTRLGAAALAALPALPALLPENEERLSRANKAARD